MVPVPHNMTNYFQPLHLTDNRSCKSFLPDKAQILYAEQEQAQISKVAPESVSVENRHTPAYTRKKSDSVLRLYSRRQGYREKWMAQI